VWPESRPLPGCSSKVHTVGTFDVGGFLPPFRPDHFRSQCSKPRSRVGCQPTSDCLVAPPATFWPTLSAGVLARHCLPTVSHLRVHPKVRCDDGVGCPTAALLSGGIGSHVVRFLTSALEELPPSYLVAPCPPLPPRVGAPRIPWAATLHEGTLCAKVHRVVYRARDC